MSPKPSPLQAQLVAKILEYIDDQGIAVGQKVVENELALHLGVSRSPIRGSLQILARAGLLNQRPGTGYVLAKALQPDDFARFEVTGAEELLYEKLAEDIFRHNIANSFKEREIIRRYGCSRSDLQKVLLRANREGIIARSAGRGWILQPSLSDAKVYYESYRLRILIEPAAILEPRFQADKKLLQSIRRRHEMVLGKHELNGIELFEMNAAFHETLAKWSGNNFILDIVRHQNQLRRLSQYYRDRSTERVAIGCKEHLAIVDALEAEDSEWAATLMRRHLTASSKRFEAIFDDA